MFVLGSQLGVVPTGSADHSQTAASLGAGPGAANLEDRQMQGLLAAVEPVDYSDIKMETPTGSFACWFGHPLGEEGAQGHRVSQEFRRLSDYLLPLVLDSLAGFLDLLLLFLVSAE